jgi:hypothetical protein
MKVKSQEQTLFNEIKSKYGLKREGFLTNFFKKSLKSKLDNDTELQQALKDADKSLERLKQNIDSLEQKGYHIPKELKKYI